MRDALLLVDVISSFRHEEGDRLAESYRQRHPGLCGLLESARSAGIPVVYANDNRGVWDGDVRGLVRSAVEDGLAGTFVAAVAPREVDRFVIKPRYSAFRLTPLRLILEALDIERVLLAGTATEMCVTQTAIDAREHGYKVSVVPEACSTVDEEDEELALRYLERVVGVRLDAVMEAVGS